MTNSLLDLTENIRKILRDKNISGGIAINVEKYFDTVGII